MSGEAFHLEAQYWGIRTSNEEELHLAKMQQIKRSEAPTKRELFAAMIYASAIVNPVYPHGETARDSVRMADELISELDKEA
jgi:hypothetical protein